MTIKSIVWGSILVIACCVSAQDINVVNQNPQYGQYDVNNPFSSTHGPDVYSSPANPYPQQPQYGQDPYDRDRNTHGQGQYDHSDRGQYGGDSPWQNPYYGGDRDAYDRHHTVIREATYFIVASRVVRPGQLYRVSVTVLREKEPLTVRASIAENGVEKTSDHKEVKEGIPETLLMKIPKTSKPGRYTLRVEGLYNDLLGGSAFSNETTLEFSSRAVSIFIQMDKPVYRQTELVRFRTIPINTELKANSEALDVYMLDPEGRIMKRWLSRQSNLGTVSLEYQLSDQPVYGEWRIRVLTQRQEEESTFLVEEYYQTRFEVNVTMPAFFFNTDPFVYGIITANYTSGAPVPGNLTIKATVRPIVPLNIKQLIEKNRLYRPKNFDHRYRQDGFYNNDNRYQPGDAYNNRDNQYRPNDIYNNPDNQYQPGGAYNNPDNQYQPGGAYNNPDNQYQQGGVYNNDIYYTKPIFEKYLNFDEQFPFWMDKPQYEPIPSLKFFDGVYEFKYPMSEIMSYVPNLEGHEVIFTATVGDKFYSEVIEGYSIARIYNSTIKVKFMGDSPQVFKPGMPLTSYVVVSYHDSSPLSKEQLESSSMEIIASVEMRSGERKDLTIRTLFMMDDYPGVWEYSIDLKQELGINGPNMYDELSQISSMHIQANFRDHYGQSATASLDLLAHYSPSDRHIKVTTSTKKPTVGRYMIFHIRSNYYVDRYNYVIVAKGIVLIVGDQDMRDYVDTLAIPLSAEMAPAATIVVWHIGKYGDVTVDSLTFPVNGISRNNFTVFINNRKARTGHEVEVAIYGTPGSFVGLSAVDRAFYTMQAGNELTYANVIKKMMSFDEHINETYQHTWLSHEGNPDELVYFPSSTFGIDANRTFAFSGLVVFTDFELPQRPIFCNASLGLAECLSGRCYDARKRCDRYYDCDDKSDEAGCKYKDDYDLSLFRKFRFNRIQRQYENVWFWKDVNISPHGRYVFNVPVPARPVHWMVSAFSMSPNVGFGLLKRAIEYTGVLPFFINVEMPNTCMQGEQVGIRITVFNYMTEATEAQVVLVGSPDYKFVHVEEDGVVRAYNPRTSFGNHQFFVYIKPQDAEIVYIPIVPTRLGDIDVTVYSETLIGKDTITRKLHVEADGLPQYRHQSMLLDLSNRAYVFQYMHVNVTETPIIPFQHDRYYVYGSNKARISVVGDVVGPIFPTIPINASSLLNLPVDCAEQNMFSFATTMYTLLYMRFTQQRNRTLEKLGFHHMNIAYQKQLSYMQPDGSFSLHRSDWNQSTPSVWLTAYCARLFQEVSTFYEWENYIYIDPTIISRSIKWLLKHQTREGAFYETTWLPDRKYNETNGTLHENQYPYDLPYFGNRSYDSNFGEQYIPFENPNYYYDNYTHHHRVQNISLTAHVLITLQTAKDLPGGISDKVVTAKRLAVEWLVKNMKNIEERENPFEIAIVSYALMKAQSADAEKPFLMLSKISRFEGGLMYWGRKPIPQPPYKIENQRPFSLPRLPYEYDAENIGATAYALMVYVARREIFVDNIVRWLNTQRLTDGGWASTSDTAAALQALIEYTSYERLRDISSLSVSVEATALPGQTKTLYVNDKNRAKLQHIDIPNAWGTVKVQAKGNGYAILQMSVQYNVDVEKFQTKPPIPAFDLVVMPHFYGKNQSHIRYTSCQRWINTKESPRSGFAVLDVTIPTGYMIQQQDLDTYTLSGMVRNLQRAKFMERKVLFFFEYLDTQDTCINFTVERWHPVANMSRYLPIRVYDYYAPERFNETIFDALSTYALDICQVCGSSQCPYCWIYNTAGRILVPLNTVIFISVIWILKYLSRRDTII